MVQEQFVIYLTLVLIVLYIHEVFKTIHAASPVNHKYSMCTETDHLT